MTSEDIQHQLIIVHYGDHKETVRDGESRTVTSTFTQLLSYDPSSGQIDMLLQVGDDLNWAKATYKYFFYVCDL